MAKPKKLFSDAERKLIIALFEEGKTDQEIAKKLEIPRTTFRDQLEYNGIKPEVKSAKDVADEKVEDALYQRAIGYSHPEDKIFNDNGTPLIVPTTRHYPPDVAAIAFWLKNRQPGKWKDKQEVENHTTPALRMQDLLGSVKRYRDAGE